MYNVLIVDDEKYVIKSLELSIDWNKLNLNLIASTDSVDEAFQILKQNTVHIVITDIQMPGLSGLDLAKKINEVSAHIILIMISGYANFSYAQEALKYGAIGYCLKPLDYEEITSYLQIAYAKLQNQNELSTDIVEYLYESDTTKLDLFLQHNQINPCCFYVATSIALPKLFPKSPSILALKLGKYKYVYLSSEPFPNNCEIKTTTPSSLGGFGICKHSIHSKLIEKTIQDCYLKSYQYFIAGHCTICDYLPKKNNFDYLSKLTSYIKDEKIAEIKAVFTQIKSCCYEDTYTIQFAFSLCNLILSSQLFNTSSDADFCYLDFDQLTAEYRSFEEMLTTLLSSIEQAILEPFSSDNRLSSNFLMILKYINENYTQDISLQNIGNTLHMNPNYISQLFKKETNTTYVKYVINLRIDYAKTLLNTTTLSVNDVCEKIGFHDYFYFLKTFKKVVGISPTQYRTHFSDNLISL